MSTGHTENIAHLESSGKETRLLINFDVSGLNEEEKKAMLHGCLRQLSLLERDCLGKKAKTDKAPTIIRIAG